MDLINGTNNQFAFMRANLFYSLDFANGCGLYVTDFSSDNFDPKIILPPRFELISWKPGKIKIFFVDKNFALWACNYDGSSIQKIAGNDDEKVLGYALNENYLCLRIQNRRRGDAFYRITQDLSNMQRLMDNVSCGVSFVIDEKYIYYNNAKKGFHLTRVDIESGASSEIFPYFSCRTQIYKNLLILATKYNFLDKEMHLTVIDRVSLKFYTTISKNFKEITCYMDDVYFIDDEWGYIYRIPIAGGEIRQINKDKVQNLDIVGRNLIFYNCNTSKICYMDLAELQPVISPPKIISSKCAQELLDDNSLWDDFRFSRNEDEKLNNLSLNEVLAGIISEHDFSSEFFDFIVFLMCSYANIHKEDFLSLFTISGYKEKPGVNPVLFVDSTTFGKSRKKGFLLATDGIYSSGNRFPFESPFKCKPTLNGIMISSGYRSAEYHLNMYKKGREDLAELINIIYAYSDSI